VADLSVTQARFLEWLLDPRPTTKSEPEGKGSQNQIAAKLGVSATTLVKWKKDPAFRAAWEKKHADVTGGIQRYAEMLEELYAIAMGRRPGTRPADQRAALMNYFELVDRYAPKKTLEIKDPALGEMDDDELLTIARRRLKVIEGGKSSKRRKAQGLLNG
jgi:hypothetical protein